MSPRCVLMLCLLVLLFLTFNSPVHAHDMWFEKTDNGYLIALGHKGDITSYQSDRIHEVIAYTINGWRKDLYVDCGGDHCKIFADEPFVAFTAFLDNKYWYVTTQGWKNQRDGSGLEIIEEGRSYKYTKHIVQWSDFLKRPLGQRIEIVPLKDPTSMKEGDFLPVQLIFEGKPLRQASLSESSNVELTHSLREISGKGPFEVKIGPPGPQLINAKYRMQVKEKQVVWFAFFLSFDSKK